LHNIKTGLLLKVKDVEDREYKSGHGENRQWHKRSWRSHFSGWRGGVLFAIVISSLVLLINTLLAALATTSWKEEEGGVVTAFMGSCKTASRLTTVLHLIINILSSLLLAASNYCMQRLVAPTRQEIDAAHAKKKWLDIGKPSLRNLQHINGWRTSLWLLLALSSVPLHLLYGLT
jgi:hypothetical protein